MNNQLIKTILFGALLGAALFAAPFFILKVLLFFLVIGFFFRIFRGRGYYHRGGGGRWGYMGWAFADKIRQMDDKEFEEFKNEYSARGRCWPGDSKEEKESEEPKA